MIAVMYACDGEECWEAAPTLLDAFVAGGGHLTKENDVDNEDDEKDHNDNSNQNDDYDDEDNNYKGNLVF